MSWFDFDVSPSGSVVVTEIDDGIVHTDEKGLIHKTDEGFNIIPFKNILGAEYGK